MATFEDGGGFSADWNALMASWHPLQWIT